MTRHRKERGFLFVTSIAILTVMTIIGTAFLGSSIQQLQSARLAHNAIHALAMADAGVNYAIWNQRWTSNAIPVTDARILSSTTSPDSLYLGGSISPTFTLSLGTTGEDTFAVWLTKYQRDIPGSDPVKGFMAISRGYFRNGYSGNYSRSVRAILQPPPDTPPTTQQEFPQLNYAIYTESDLRVNTSTNVNGNGGGGIGTNGSAYLSTSSGGYIQSNVYSAGSVSFDKNKTTVQGNLRYGTKVLDTKGNDISALLGTSVTGTAIKDAVTMLVPEMNSDEYLAWAQYSGATNSIYYGTRITTADVIKTDILYVNPDKTPGFVLNIDTDIKKSGLVFVNGDISVGGNVQLGVYDAGGNSKPLVLVATGSVLCSGSSYINGIIWNKGSFGGGTPTVNGSIICNNVTSFQGNPYMIHRKYTVPVLPCDISNYEHAWRVAGWEELH